MKFVTGMVENIVGIGEEMLVIGTFSSSHNVLKKFLSQGC